MMRNGGVGRKADLSDAGLGKYLRIVPLFLKHKVLFVHIPKCGGDTFSGRMQDAGDAPFLFVPDGSVMVNGHTPQHLTWRELGAMGWVTPPDFRVITIVRHPVDRVLSAYRYAKAYRSELSKYVRNPNDFIGHFFDEEGEAYTQFDQHNLGILDFIRGADGQPAKEIEVWPLRRMDELLASFDLAPARKKDRRNVTKRTKVFEEFQLKEIRRRVREDLDWFEARFPDIKESGRS